MKKSLALFATGLLLLTACKSPFSSEEGTTRPEEETEVQEVTDSITETAQKEKSCEDSGGTYKNGTCSCPEDTYGNQNTPIFVYNEKTGYCEDPDGVPGGIYGTDGKGAEL